MQNVIVLHCNRNRLSRVDLKPLLAWVGSAQVKLQTQAPPNQPSADCQKNRKTPPEPNLRPFIAVMQELKKLTKPAADMETNVEDTLEPNHHK